MERRNLVVAIWDKDSKSRDDFMAGVRHLVNNFDVVAKCIVLCRLEFG